MYGPILSVSRWHFPECRRTAGGLVGIMAKSVLIVDDSAIVRKVMRQFFESLADWDVRGEAADGDEAIQKAMELRPDLILLDVSMPKLNGIAAASVLKKIISDVRIIVFTLFDDALGSGRLSSAVGVDLVISKADGLTGLVKAVHHLMGTTRLIKADSKVDCQQPSAPEQA